MHLFFVSLRTTVHSENPHFCFRKYSFPSHPYLEWIRQAHKHLFAQQRCTNSPSGLAVPVSWRRASARLTPGLAASQPVQQARAPSHRPANALTSIWTYRASPAFIALFYLLPLCYLAPPTRRGLCLDPRTLAASYRWRFSVVVDGWIMAHASNQCSSRSPPSVQSAGADFIEPRETFKFGHMKTFVHHAFCSPRECPRLDSRPRASLLV
ncbi:uncharacterized protein B0H18DRAFT_425243 [Fomitopsis serialis]|uniref:uncharacterized protein n=1 Tax=Fomitopsis serialis TaxID=139415 RepID=UPI0020081B24|nr:uncharacterized protein B0H18DRAFT_425243 [Neoantrodia serialis]KAH9924539.1 hypothetical protein B0H18DRAFT_425243 [Neoantrodia serialis]